MTDIRDTLQQSLGSAYTIERELGGGGMSRTYVAEETSLHRRVVVKVLSPDLAAGVSVDRFKREIQLAAALQHPHIVPVLSAGDTYGLPYYTMPFVAGESLRARLARGPLTITESVGILRDVAKALAFAHEQGVVHRDIKPDNVLLSGGSATVADFGIAKAISAARTDAPDATLTQVGTALGTPTYMAPEQAAGDPNADHRADIYAFGVMAYEMLAGQTPFHGLTPQKLLAAHMAERPRQLGELRANIPAAMAELVMRCLEKEAGHRPQSATDIVRYLDTVTSGSGQTASAAVLLGGQVSLAKALAIYAGAFVLVAVLAKAAIVGIGLPDWVFPGAVIVMALGLPAILLTYYVQRATRRALTATPTLTPGGTRVGQGTLVTMAMKASPHVSWRRTALGGVAAVGALIVLTGAWMVMRAFGIGPAASLISSGKLDAQERVILAEFKSPATDSLLGPTVTEAFRTDLAQSASLRIMPAAAVRGVLQRMQRPTTMRVDYGVAREIATREGIKAVIDGDIVTLGGRYVLSARLVSAQDGEDLATFREEASDESDIIPAISRLSKQVRSRVGESLRAVQNAKTLDKVTTPSLEALQKYVSANRMVEVEGDFARFEKLMTEAIALDTGFAMAYRKLAVELGNRGLQRQRVTELLQKAYENMDRLSETERFILLGTYYMSGLKQDIPRAVSALESLLEIDSTSVTALNNLAVMYHLQGQYAKQESLAVRAVAVQPTAAVFFNNLVHSRAHLGKLAEAREAVDIAVANIPRNPDVAFMRVEVLEEELKIDSADAIMDSLAKARANDLPTRNGVLFERSALKRINGKLREAIAFQAEQRRIAVQLGNRQAAINAILDTAEYDVRFRDNGRAAAMAVERAATHPVMDSVPEATRPYSRLIDFASASGRIDRAKATLSQFEKSSQVETPDGQRALQAARGHVARADRQFDNAIASFRQAIGGACPDCGLPDLGFTYDLAGQSDSAIAVYSRYTQARAVNIVQRATWLPMIHRRLGELYDAKGNVEQALTHYTQFVELWKNADSDMQPQVQKVRDRIRELQRRRG
ncbi:MAG TPA: protein kinase [Gemmatimonadaceae bacterium]|nr:protein kinase [Gemmatimonadaceae bacterium]